MKSNRKIPEGIDFQGHRGCRGIMPENTLVAFLHAIDLGVTTLEMDVVITQDKKVVVSHEPYMSFETCLTPQGKPITREEEKRWNIYNMNYKEVMQWDCGSKPHPRFPIQRKVKSMKPLLSEVLKETQAYIRQLRIKDIFYNIEIKSTAKTEGEFHPKVELFCDLVMEEIMSCHVLEYVTIQSFDPRALQYLHLSHSSDFWLSYLLENVHDYQNAVKLLKFTPDILSPSYDMVDQGMMEYAKKRQMRVIPWTVNELADMQRLLSLGVDGLISDYPNYFKELK